MQLPRTSTFSCASNDKKQIHTVSTESGVDEPMRISKTEAGPCFKAVVVGLFSLLLPCGSVALAQTGAVAVAPVIEADPGGAPVSLALDPPAKRASLNPLATASPRFSGLRVSEIRFTGVSVSRLGALPSALALQPGTGLSESKTAQSLRQLFATGLYNNLEVAVTADGSSEKSVVIEFRGTPRTFIGTVTVEGAKGTTMDGQMEQGSQLVAGNRFTQAKVDHALDLMREVMANNGFYRPTITPTYQPHVSDQLMDVSFHVVSGPQARVGQVKVSGETGMSVEEFRHATHLRAGSLVDHDTRSHALANVLSRYRKQDRLEAEIKLVSHQYSASTNLEDFEFMVNRGPLVHVHVNGAKASNGLIRRLIPVYQEGAVDDDLLNEGNRNLRNYYQRQGFFSVKVDHQSPATNKDQVLIEYSVHLGQRRRIEKVEVKGNHYFNTETLKDRLTVHAANAFDRHGSYSQAMLAADVASIQAIYQSNGFSSIKVTPVTSEAQPAPAGKQLPLRVVYFIDEGQQQRVASLRLNGAVQIAGSELTPILNTAVGQPLSPQNLAGDRDTLMTYYLSQGFNQMRVDVVEKPIVGDLSKVEVEFQIHEGSQTFVRNVLMTGLHYTRPSTVARAITLKAGDPMSESALSDTQRNLYDLALFNQVDTAIENPTGEESQKTVLIKAIEARRWALTYGLGFEVQTGTCGTFSSGSTCGGTNGKTGASPRVLLDITRSNFFGREQSISLRGTYGLLEQRINLLYHIPHLHSSKDFGLDLSGGYANSQDVTTYVASKLEANLRLNQHFLAPGAFLSRANTLVYQLAFRRVQVAASSLQVQPDEVKALSAPVRVSGPGFTWIRDTRDSPLDAHRGTYTSFQEYFSNPGFGAEALFNRVDLSNSSFLSFDKDRFVIARITRYGQERSYGSAPQALLPLPERLFAGGSNSHRGFGSNSAGPRDPITGYPIGGAGVFVNSTEFRLPPPILPWFGDTLSFVLFHDMGNVFTNAGDIWPSVIRTVQPNRATCRIPTTTVTGPYTATGHQGACSFNYFDHAVGTGLRYHTPVGPIRLDFSYNLNPPIYPVCGTCNSTAMPPPTPNLYVGQGAHFNFFFSLGQTF